MNEEDASTLPRILVLDDDPSTALLWTTALQRAGFAALSVCDPEQAHQSVRRFRPQIVIVDLALGATHGHDLGPALRAADPALHLIAVTGDDRDRTRARSLALGFAAHLIKPVSTHQLRAAVERLLAPGRAAQGSEAAALAPAPCHSTRGD